MLKILLVFLATGAALVAADASQVQLSLANTILASAPSIAGDPQRSAQCFGAYMPKLNELTATYQQRYQDCQQKAQNKKTIVRNEVQDAAGVVNKTREEICNALADCVFDSEPYGYFDCSNQAADASLSKAYSIETLSKDRMQYITLRYETISYDENVCTGLCSQTYVEDSAKIHAQLQDCLDGKIEVESTTAS